MKSVDFALLCIPNNAILTYVFVFYFLHCTSNCRRIRLFAEIDKIVDVGGRMCLTLSSVESMI